MKVGRRDAMALFRTLISVDFQLADNDEVALETTSKPQLQARNSGQRPRKLVASKAKIE